MTNGTFNARCSACLRELYENLDGGSPGPIAAIDLASKCGIAHWEHETKRRRIREVIEDLRRQGHKIVAGFRKDSETGCELGYWMARDDAEWKAYL